MNISLAHDFAAPLDRVIAMFADEGFARARAEAAGATEVDVIIDGDADGEFLVAIRRTVPTANIPAEFRGLVGSTLSVRYNEAWDAPEDEGRDGTFAVEIVGAPARATGTITLTPEGDATHVDIDGVVKTTMPLLAGLIENAVAGAIDQALKAELRAADSWLASA